MKKFNIGKVKFAIASSVFAAILLTSSAVFAQDLESTLSQDFEEWLKLPEEERTDFNMPIAYDVELSDSYLTEYLNKKSIDSNYVPDMINNFTDLGSVGNIDLNSVGASSSDSTYDMRNALNLRVENQQSTNECWAFSILKSMETNIALTNGTRNLGNFSERHMDYTCSKTFSDGVNPNGFSREVGTGGLPIIGLAYLSNGSGAVTENNMPFENNEKKIPLSSINKPVDTVVTDYVIFPQIKKKYTVDSDGNTTSVRYFDASGNEYTSLRVEAIRNQIKEHIVKYGSVTTMTVGSNARYYDSTNIYRAKNYNCNEENARRDHAISIVGWDDNYSRDNFKRKPLTDGAYIIQNSYGSSSFDNGYMYISYEDFYVEAETYGICATSKVDYDRIYQHDFFGGVHQLGSSSTSVGYIATTYDRNSSGDEYIDSVGVQIPQETKLEIFINPNDSRMDSNSLTKVAETGYLSTGYHKINIEKTQLKGSTFAIVVKQTSKTGKFYFSVELAIEGSAYAEVTSDNKSFYSVDGLTYTNLKNVKVNGADSKTMDVCIKAFTKGGLIPDDPEPQDPQPQDPQPQDPQPQDPQPQDPQPQDPQPEDPKPEDPQPQDPQPEDPKPEDPKPEDPKPEDPKPEDPKPEDPKPEDPKPEDPKPEDPKPEDPKPEDPKPEDPKPEDPKPEDPKPEDPKPEDPKPEDPKPEEKYFSSDVYKEYNNYLRNIEHSTSVEKFKKNIKTNYEYKIFDLSGNDVTNVKANIKTGYKLKYGEKELILVVKGDINRDGVISITDIGQQLYHFLEKKGYVLTGERKEACDINMDNQVTITDLTQLMFIFEDID